MKTWESCPKWPKNCKIFKFGKKYKLAKKKINLPSSNSSRGRCSTTTALGPSTKATIWGPNWVQKDGRRTADHWEYLRKPGEYHGKILARNIIFAR